MFELSDDEDENFWNDMPLHDVTKGREDHKNGVTVQAPQLRVPESTFDRHPAKKLRTERSYVREPVDSCNNINSGEFSKENVNIARIQTFQRSDLTTQEPVCSRLREPGSTNGMNLRQQTTRPLHALNVKSMSLAEAQNTPNLTSDISVDYVTPKRKRKFPGPAGVLPKLTPGQSFDIGMHASTPEILPKKNKSPQEDMVILSSQSSENLFQDDPWQALLKDIGDQGLSIMKKFSIASTLLKAGKKQLPYGKAWLVFGIIESIENHGAEASASIKDRSGNMHGTIHTDLMTEYEVELQVGTVLVLKQVSIISLSNKNHYLNITPNNLVSLYHIKENTLKAMHFHGSQDSLHSVLKALERESMERRHVATPDSASGSSRLSSDRSGTNTPVLSTGTPDVQSLNKRLFNTHSPGNQPQRLAGVRDVSVVQRQSIRNTPYLRKPDISPALRSNNPTNNCLNDTNYGANKPDVSSVRQLNNSTNNSLNTTTNYSGNRSSISSSSSSSNNSTFQNNITNSAKRAGDVTPNVPASSSSKWRFRSPSTAGTTSSNVDGKEKTSCISSEQETTSNQNIASLSNNRLDGPVPSGRVCQLQVTSAGSNRCAETVSNTKPGDKHDDHGDLWEDDLTDELLSQLSDPLT